MTGVARGGDTADAVTTSDGAVSEDADRRHAVGRAAGHRSDAKARTRRGGSRPGDGDRLRKEKCAGDVERTQRLKNAVRDQQALVQNFMIATPTERAMPITQIHPGADDRDIQVMVAG